MDAEQISFLHRKLGPAFEKRVITVEPGCSRPYDAAEWRDAIVVIEGGEIDLECSRSGRRRFRSGEVLWLAGLSLLALHNEGIEPAVIVAVRRRAPAPDPRSPPPG